MSSTSKKRTKKLQTFKEDYNKKWKCIVSSKKGPNYARCTVCTSDFSIGHGGSNDVQWHIKTQKHQSAVGASSSNTTMEKFLISKDSSVIRAEVLMTNFLIEHNIAFSAADHLSDIVTSIFPDSDIARKFSCKRTKATAIGRTLGQVAKEAIVEKLRARPFSISTDGSSDRGAQEQLYPIIVRYYDDEHIVSSLLEISSTKERSTGKNIFLLLDKALKEYSIPWRIVIGYSADNASVMMGEISGVAAFIRKSNPNTFINGCLCHRLHLAGEKGAKELAFCPGDLLIKIFYYLEKSSKRQKEFKEVQQSLHVADHVILKYICTRWLSLEASLGRLLEQWEPLLVYFREEAQTKYPRATRAKKSTTSTTKQPSSSVKSTTSTTKQPSSSVKSTTSTTMQPSSSVKSTTSTTKQASTSVKGSHVHTQVFSGDKHCPHIKTGENVSKLKRKMDHDPVPVPSKKSVHSTSPMSATNVFFPSSVKSVQSRKEQTTGKSSEHTSKSKVSQNSEATKNKAGEIYDELKNDRNKLYCLFLQHTIPLLNTLNLKLQKDEPQIHLLHDLQQELLRNILIRFVKPSVISAAVQLDKCGYHLTQNQREDDELIIGSKVRLLLREMPPTTCDEFFTTVRRYFISVCNYITRTFPLNDEVLFNAQVADISKRQESKFASVAFFVHKFHYMEDSIDDLEIEFGHFQVDPLESVSLQQRSDEAWIVISQMTDETSGENCLKYGNLAKVMLAILSLPHSNAEDERLFSLVRKNATVFRPNISKAVLSDVLTQKVYSQSKNFVCHRMVFDEKTLDKCKKAASDYNKK